MSPTKTTQKSTKSTATGKSSKGFSAEEKAAMRERAKELKAAATRAEEAEACLASIAQMREQDRAVAKRVHALITEAAPDIAPKTWYGMPAYAKDGKTICFFRPSEKFNTRYSTLGFNDAANLDEGNFWPTDFAILKLSAADEARIAALVKKAVS